MRTSRCVGRLLAVIVLNCLTGWLRRWGHLRLTAHQPVQRAVATRWSDLHLQLVRQTAGFTLPVASRALGYLG
jgi:hypothetical protein